MDVVDVAQHINIPHEELREIFSLENERYSLNLYVGPDHIECWAWAEVFLACPEMSDRDDNTCENGDESEDENWSLESEEKPDTSEYQKSCNTFAVPSHPLPPYEMISILKKLGITKTIDYAALYEFCAVIANGTDPEPTLIARGFAPQKGPDGWLDLRVKIYGSDIDLKEDESGYVDHKKLNRFSDIKSGQKLAIVRSPGRGTPGMSVQGLPVAAETGDSFSLTAGEGVMLKYDERVAFAIKPGKAILENNTLRIDDHLKINGNVDLSIGDIDFKGVVEISGEVQDGFDVKASSGLYINGHVGSCQIESGGEIEIVSMSGKGVGTIICHGSLKAAYLNQVTIYCYGNVVVSKEIRSCQVKSTGFIKVESGSIIGGECVAYAGIDAQNLGAPSALKTKVTSGIYFPDEDRFAYLRQRREQIRHQLKSITEAIEPLKRLIRNKPSLAATAEKRLKILESQLAKLHEDKILTRAELQTYRQQQPEGQNPKINIHKKLYEGVEIRLGQTRNITHQITLGPISILEDIAQNDFIYAPLSELSVTAAHLYEQIKSV